MKTWIFFFMALVAATYMLATLRRKPSQRLGSVDAIVPAYNEEPCIAQSLEHLLRNPYLAKVICVNDGSTDGTARVLEQLARKWDGRLIVLNQVNTGKGGALMNGLRHATAAQVFLTDADTHVPADSHGLGYMLAEIERGADAVGGIPSSNLRGAGFLPHVRATVKLPMIIIKRTFQQMLGGAPFIISGACGMFRTEVLRRTGFSDRTKVEDLDLTGRWWDRDTAFARLTVAWCFHRSATPCRRNGDGGGVGSWATPCACACIGICCRPATASPASCPWRWSCSMASTLTV